MLILPLNAQEGDNNGKWFFEQRVYPYDTMPMTSYVNALEYQKDLTDNLGFTLSAPLQWTSIGPTPYLYGGEKTGRITCVQYYPKVPGYTEHPDWIYLTAHGGGVWRSTNGGTSFNPLTDNLGCLTSGAIAFDPNNPNIIYYGTGGSVYGFQYNYGGIGVYKSTDAGLTWSGPYKQGFLKDHIRTFKIAVNPANSNHVYLACGTDPFYYPPNGDGGGGLYKSTDGGITWAIAPGTPEHKACNDVVIYYDGESVNRIYAAGMGNFGYYVSNNGGANFSLVSDGVFWQGGRTHLAIPNPSSNIVYAVSVLSNYTPEPDPDRRNGVFLFVSTNGGYNFSFKRIKTQNVDLSAAASFMSVNASPHDPQKVLVGFGEFFLSAGLYLSTNGGTNFTSLSSIPGGDQNSVAFNPYTGYENEILVGDDQGAYKSTNLGTNFINLNSTLTLTEGYRIAVSPDNQNYFLAVTDAGFFKRNSTNSTIWTDTDFGADGTQIVASKFDPLVFLGSKGCQCQQNPWLSPHMRFTTNAGTTPWNGRAISWGHWDGDQDWVAAITQYPKAEYPNTFLHLRRNRSSKDYIDINVTTDNGNVWQQNGNFAGYDPAPIYTQDEFSAPVQLVFVENSPNIIYATAKSVTYGHHGPHASEIYKSSDYGASWTKLNSIHNTLPNRVITALAIDPRIGKENVLYATLSGYSVNSPGGHVYKSTDYGSNWVDISNPPSPGTGAYPPDIPVNDIIVRPISATQNQLIIATDAGVYRTLEPDLEHVGGIWWKTLASGLPNAVSMDLDYNHTSRKLRVSTFGRGAFEVQLDATIYVPNEMNLVSSTSDLEISEDIVVSSGSTLRVPNSVNIKLPAGKKIIIEDGGQIDVSSGAAVTFTSQSGTWGGIEFQGDGFGTLKNCTFSNTNSPIVITGGFSSTFDPPDIIIEDCHFTNGTIEVTNKPDVTVKYSDWTMNNSSYPDAIIAAGAEDIYLLDNDITYTTYVAGSHAVQLSQCNNSIVTLNTITNADYPVTVSNATSYLRYNDITTSYPSTSYEGIYLNGVNNGHLTGNDVSGYQTGYYFNYYSSPLVLQNNADGSNSNGNKTAIYCFGSSPRLTPSIDGSSTVWDAGLNTFRNDDGESIGLYMEEDSEPALDYGYNLIYGATNIYGTYPYGKWSIRCNSWENDPPVFTVYSPAIEFYPSDCTPPGLRPLKPNSSKEGGSERENENETAKEGMSPQQIIVNYGNGLIDTLQISISENRTSADIGMIGTGDKEVYRGNFETAADIFKNLISTYQDSSTAIQALSRIFYCYDRMNIDSTGYSALRTYYNTLASNNSIDTLFVKTSQELSRKCFIKQRNFPSAISAYEEVIENSSDSSEIKAAEISIIEIYILMGEGEGDAMSFTGRYSQLKPSGLRDAMNRIREKMGHKQTQLSTGVLPEQFSLSQNYPNPFNPVTKINFSLSNPTKVTLKVYDILGKTVKVLMNEFKDKGIYSVTFDGTGLASGIYFYTIEAGTFKETKKMVLVK
jgi:hypothetical protein